MCRYINCRLNYCHQILFNFNKEVKKEKNNVNKTFNN